MTIITGRSGSSLDSWARAIVMAAQGVELSPSIEETRLQLLAAPEQPLQARIVAATGWSGLACRFASLKTGRSSVLAPFIAELSDGDCIIVRAIDDAQATVTIMTDGGSIDRDVSRAWLDGAVAGPVLLFARRRQPRDRRIEAYLAPYQASWFRSLLASHMGRFVELSAGAFSANLLALATAIFAMQVWDRVIPSQSLPTLWVLTLGVALALLFELMIKLLRASITDTFGKDLDLKISTMFFARALDLRNDARPRSPGTLIAQLRELDQIRELMTSTTLSVLFEIPFVATFIFVISLIGGPLVFVVMGVIPIVLLLCFLVQWPMARLSREGLRESALRNAMLVESIQRIEDIKSLQAEARFTAVWASLNATNASISKRNRFLSAMITNATLTLQQAAYVAVLVAGAHLVLDNVMTTGALLACSMLTSRAIAPLAQIAGVLARLQGARVARQGLDSLLQLPTDHGGTAEKFHRPLLKPDITFEGVIHTYEKDQAPALVVPKLTIRAGEKVALIGRIGSGKSTLLKLAAGLMPPREGRLLVDGTEMTAIQMADIRRDIGSYHQDAGLFFGTVRSNLQLGAQHATDEDLLAALATVGASTQIFSQGHGLDATIQEGGRGLSSGQRQALILARALVRSPRALLLDEPTGAMDESTEQAFVASLRQWLGPRTLIVATHRYAVLDIVDRVIVVDQGRIVLDGPRADVLSRLAHPATTDAKPAKPVARPPALVANGMSHGA